MWRRQKHAGREQNANARIFSASFLCPQSFVFNEALLNAFQ